MKDSKERIESAENKFNRTAGRDFLGQDKFCEYPARTKQRRHENLIWQAYLSDMAYLNTTEIT